MPGRGGIVLYAASVVIHAAIAVGIGSIEEPTVRPPIRVTMRTPPPRAERPEPPPEVTPPEPPPSPPPAEPAPAAPERPRTPRAPAAEAPSAPAPVPAAPSVPAVPSFGIAMSGGTGPGIAVPIGDPGGTTSPAPPVVRETRRALEAAAPPVADDDGGCPEEETRPRALSMPPPRYTDEARAAAIEGRVRVEIHVDATGTVTDATVLSSLDAGLDAAALEAARAARFAPATRCGEPVEATFTVSIRFEL